MGCIGQHDEMSLKLQYALEIAIWTKEYDEQPWDFGVLHFQTKLFSQRIVRIHPLNFRSQRRQFGK